MSQVWLITGANAGFGRALTEQALAAGHTVVAAVRRPEAMELRHERLSVVNLDVTDSAAIPGVVEQVGRIDVLVNNAGRGMVGAAEETSDEELRGLMELHFFGPVALTKAVLPGMRERKSGTVVQLSSQGGRFAFAGISAYSGSKFAIEGWSEALAAETKQFGIRVLIVEPGAFRTSFNEPSALHVAEISSVYEGSVGAVRDALSNGNGTQPGDPVRAARAILTAVASPEPPLRLPLGSDAVEALQGVYAGAQTDLATWADLSRSADFPS
ncbi:SDR family NAD(P)-dependent oxidoreductase [Kribbella sp. NBC_00709]|uniref:SDR family NAD(P)-dependent oxidoreductase n=1 Tax=Kribbella sp. NBC_00709 TaxID=2975972 RepID=UPI002E2E0258|nr:SDR family NAD(P)-dependent oxidoreductase [Kribbella sp. NBC_00709]